MRKRLEVNAYEVMGFGGDGDETGAKGAYQLTRHVCLVCLHVSRYENFDLIISRISTYMVSACIIEICLEKIVLVTWPTYERPMLRYQWMGCHLTRPKTICVPWSSKPRTCSIRDIKSITSKTTFPVIFTSCTSICISRRWRTFHLCEESASTVERYDDRPFVRRELIKIIFLYCGFNW